MIIPIHIVYSLTYSTVETADSIAIDNGSNNTVGGSCYSAHQAVTRFAGTTLIWSIGFIANARLEQVYLEMLISRLNVSL